MGGREGGREGGGESIMVLFAYILTSGCEDGA